MPPTMPASSRLKWAAAGWILGFLGSVLAVLVAAFAFDVGRVSEGAGDGAAPEFSLGWLLLLQVPMWIGLVGTPLLARGRGLRWREQMGWRMRPRDVPVGAVVGLVMQFVLLPLLYVPILRLFDDLDVEGPARDLTEQAGGPLEIAALVFMTVVAAPLTEEVFFRGLLQGALRDRLGPVRAVAIASCAFAVVHFQAVQFPALLVVGLVHGLLVLATGRLGPAIWSHAVFNAATVTVLLL